MEEVRCLSCNRLVEGRRGKKYCDTFCKAQFHNLKNQGERSLYCRTNNILRRNHKILDNLQRLGRQKVRRKELVRLGYRLDFHTHSMERKDSEVYYFCYNKGYRQVEEDWLELIPDESLRLID